MSLFDTTHKLLFNHQNNIATNSGYPIFGNLDKFYIKELIKKKGRIIDKEIKRDPPYRAMKSNRKPTNKNQNINYPPFPDTCSQPNESQQTKKIIREPTIKTNIKDYGKKDIMEDIDDLDELEDILISSNDADADEDELTYTKSDEENDKNMELEGDGQNENDFIVDNDTVEYVSSTQDPITEIKDSQKYNDTDVMNIPDDMLNSIINDTYDEDDTEKVREPTPQPEPEPEIEEETQNYVKLRDNKILLENFEDLVKHLQEITDIKKYFIPWITIKLGQDAPVFKNTELLDTHMKNLCGY